MKNCNSLSLKFNNNKLEILDQRHLPKAEVWTEIKNPLDMIEAIQQLKVRGAPLIGVAAAVSLAHYAEQGASENEFMSIANEMRKARPTAVNLMFAIDKICSFKNYHPQEIVATAEQLFLEDVQLCADIARHGEKFLADGDNVLTHCNTGGLATVGSGTALAVIKKAYDSGKKIHVFVDETRPLLQGARLTTWELEKYKIPYTLICDNMAAALMAQGKVQKVIVGADRIARNGDFANKTGTYGLALAAKFHQVPFYCAAPYTTIDADCINGQQIPIEQRSDFEVQGVRGAFGEVQWAPVDSPTYNPAFDVTPATLVSAWILDKGAYTEFNLL
ncbi:MAG: S-methyl-5-thioribose-1-phosphate isomerase [Bdellovibrionales bacterium]|nr:S-methyl-5-thioribose-1-phosphate isomerase [Bdellovibrionales bacterium]